MHNKRELRCHGVRKKKKMKEEKRSCAACHAAFSSSWRKKTIHEMLLFFKVFYGDYLEEGKSAAQQIRRSTFKCFICKRIHIKRQQFFFFWPKCVCSPEYPDQSSVYGESRGVSPVFLRPKLKTAMRRSAPTVPTELQREKR